MEMDGEKMKNLRGSGNCGTSDGRHKEMKKDKCGLINVGHKTGARPTTGASIIPIAEGLLHGLIQLKTKNIFDHSKFLYKFFYYKPHFPFFLIVLNN